MITFLNRKHLLLGIVFLILSACTKNESNENNTAVSSGDDTSDEKSSVELAYFTIDDLNLVTTRELMIEKFGKPDNEAIHSHDLDTLHTVYYKVDNTEIAFEQKGDRVFFSYLEFMDSSKFKFKNDYATFSKETKFDPFKLLFYNSVENATLHDGRKIITIKVEDREKSWIRFEFERDRLRKINFDTVY